MQRRRPPMQRRAGILADFASYVFISLFHATSQAKGPKNDMLFFFSVEARRRASVCQLGCRQSVQESELRSKENHKRTQDLTVKL